MVGDGAGLGGAGGGVGGWVSIAVGAGRGAVPVGAVAGCDPFDCGTVVAVSGPSLTLGLAVASSSSPVSSDVASAALGVDEEAPRASEMTRDSELTLRFRRLLREVRQRPQ